MRIYTAHIHSRKPPVLVREGFAWGGLFFGPLWLLRYRAWIAGAIALALLVLVCLAAPPHLRPPLACILFVLTGVFGNDLRRWSLGLGHFDVAHVVAARDRDEAFLRLLDARADLRVLSA